MNILALSPHTDDSELGAGGTLARFVEEGHNVVVVAFSTGNPQTGAYQSEFEAAMGELGIVTYELLDYETRHFSEVRQDILDCLINLRARFNPDVVLVPSTVDRHQDHQIVTAEAIRAFRHASILGYTLPTSHELPANLRFFVRLGPLHIGAKLLAVQCYRSQAKRAYCEPNYLHAVAQVCGVQIGAEYAEAFEVLKWIVGQR